MLVDFAKSHFLQFWEQGGRPALLFSYTPMKDWKPQDKKPGVEIIDAILYQLPETCFASDVDTSTIDEVRRLCYHFYLRTYFRQWRSQFGWKHSWLDINNSFESYVQYYWNKLNQHKINIAVFAGAPHNGSDIILYYVCKVLGIKTLICTASLFPNGMWLHQDIEDVGADEIQSRFAPISMEIDDNPIPPFYMKGAGKMSFLEFVGGVTKQSSRIAVKGVTLSFLWNPRSFEKNFFKLRATHRSFNLHQRAKALYSEFEPDKNYIYFPLHLQPEQTTDIYGGKYADQLLAIEELARALPKDILIYVKENPKQTLYMRDPSFFRRLRDIPAVRYFSVEVSTYDLTRHSLAVATISGTAGWEAIQMGKPVICFGYGWYRGLPGVFEWRQVKNRVAEALSGFKFDKDQLRKVVLHRSRCLWPGILDHHYGELVENYDPDVAAAEAAKSILSYLRIIGVDELGNPLPSAEPSAPDLAKTA